MAGFYNIVDTSFSQNAFFEMNTFNSINVLDENTFYLTYIEDSKAIINKYVYNEPYLYYQVEKQSTIDHNIIYTSIIFKDDFIYLSGHTTENVVQELQGYNDLIVTKLNLELELEKHFQYGGSGDDIKPHLVSTPDGITLVSNTNSSSLGSNGLMDISIITLDGSLVIDATSVLTLEDDIEIMDVFYDDGLYIGGTVDGSGFISLIE